MGILLRGGLLPNCLILNLKPKIITDILMKVFIQLVIGFVVGQINYTVGPVYFFHIVNQIIWSKYGVTDMSNFHDFKLDMNQVYFTFKRRLI